MKIKNQKCEIAPLPPRPFLPREKRKSLPSCNPKGVCIRNSIAQRKKLGKIRKKCLRAKVHGTPINPIHFSCVRERQPRNLLWGGGIKMWMQMHFLKFNPIFHKSSPLINSPNQNEIVGRFPGRVHSLVVRLFPVWTPSQTSTVAIDLCGVNGLVAVH
jgi:hypothetical protein